MLNYVFVARTNEGAMVSGDMRADSLETVVNLLKQKGYYLLSVKPENRLSALVRAGAGLRNRVGMRDKAIFTRQLATLLRAGMRLSTALDTLSKQTENKYLAFVIRQLQRDIEQSSSLSEAMAKHPRVFPRVYTAVIEAAEEAGSLAETLTTLSEQLKTRVAVNARVRAALAYPIFLSAVSAAVVVVLTAFVIPKFIELFVNVNQRLPLPTRILVGATDGFRQFWPILSIAAVCLASLGFLALREARVRLAFDGLLLRLPTIGILNRKLQLARFARTLGSLLNGGVKIVSAVKIVKGTASNRAFAAEIGEIEEGILKGCSLAKIISQQRDFSEIAANMVAVGEETGMLPEMLLELADMYDQECESAIGAMTNLLGPVLIVVLGTVIGFVVMAILLPIFETSTMLS